MGAKEQGHGQHHAIPEHTITQSTDNTKELVNSAAITNQTIKSKTGKRVHVNGPFHCVSLLVIQFWVTHFSINLNYIIDYVVKISATLGERAVLQSRRGGGSIASLLMNDHEEMQPVMTTEGKPLKEYVEAFERMLIDNTMRRHRGSIASVMEELCLPRRTLNEKMAKYGLQRADYL